MERLGNAIIGYNRDVDRMINSGLYDFTPNKTSLKHEMGRIRTAKELKRRIEELNRIHQDVNPYSFEPVDRQGRIVPRYLAEEIRSAMSDVDLEHRQLRASLFPGWGSMSSQQQAYHAAGSNISDLGGEYMTGDDLEALLNERYAETDAAYFENYIEAWHEYCTLRSSEQEVVDNIRWLLDNRPGAIREILARGDIRANIDYIYEQSADFTEIRLRHQNIIDFWEDMRASYE